MAARVRALGAYRQLLRMADAQEALSVAAVEKMKGRIGVRELPDIDRKIGQPRWRRFVRDSFRNPPPQLSHDEAIQAAEEYAFLIDGIKAQEALYKEFNIATNPTGRARLERDAARVGLRLPKEYKEGDSA